MLTLSQKVPPQAIDAERALLAHLLRHPESIDDVPLRAEMFYHDGHRVIYGTMQELRREGVPVDAITIGARIALGGSDVDALIDQLANTESSNPEAYAALVREKWMLRAMLGIAHDAAEACYAGDSGVIDRVGQLVTDLAMSNTPDRLVYARDALEEALAEIDDTSAPAGLSTGLAALDAVFKLRRGELTVVAARPGMGKSARAFENAARVAKNGGGALCFSLEMPNKQCVIRLACQEADVNLAKVLAKGHTPEERARLAFAKKQMDSWPLILDATPGTTLADVRAKARKVRRELAHSRRDLELIVIDYLQLMGGMDAEATRDLGISKTTRGLKTLALELNIPIMLLSQINRAGESQADKRPTMSMLRESGAIENDADNILFIYRDEYYSRAQTKMAGVAEIIVAKQRNGPAGGSYFVHFSGETTSFRDLTQAERLAAGLNAS